MPLTAPRDTPRVKDRPVPQRLILPVAAGVKIWRGGLTCVEALGFAVPGSVSLTIKQAGRALMTVDNTGGQDGDKNVKIDCGVFLWKNSTSDPVTNSKRFKACFVEDDETVSHTDGSGTRAKAGIIIDVIAGVGVQVMMGPATA